MGTTVSKHAVIRGSGSSSGKSSSSSFTEAADTASNNQVLERVHLLGSGPWHGPIHADQPLRGVYEAGTPVQNADGTYNWTIASGSNEFAFAWGYPDQDPISGFAAPSSATTVGVEVRADRPAVRQINDTRITSVVLTLGSTSLKQTSADGGSIGGVCVDLAVDIAEAGGEYRCVGYPQFNEKASSGLARNYRIDLTGTTGPWRVRVRRLSADTNSSLIEDKIYWQSYTRKVEYQFSYPGEVLMAERLYAKDFSNSVPETKVEFYRSIVEVPANYDPFTRAYATTGEGTTNGVWDGTFKQAWTDNLAWIFRDACLNVRDGLGSRIAASALDKWALYALAQYCDELVDDGFGGKEPRFSCNVDFSEQVDAGKALVQLAGIVNAILFCQGGQIGISQDVPQTPSHLFTNANVINGQFHYESTALENRHSCANVSWNNPDNLYEPEIEYVPFQPAIERYGMVPLDIVALGCNSRGQAHRAGLYCLLAEWLLDETNTWGAGLEGASVALGEVCSVRDRNRAPNGERFGGRLKAVSADLRTVTLDAPVLIDATKGALLTVVLPDGELCCVTVINPGSDTAVDTLTLASALPAEPVDHAVWSLAVGEDADEQWRVLGKKETAVGQYEISAIKYDPALFELLEGIKLDPQGVKRISQQRAASVITAPTELKYAVSLIAGTTTYRLTVGWAKQASAASYALMWREASGNWIQLPEMADCSVDIDGVSVGAKEFKLTCANAFGQCASVVGTFTVKGTAAALPATAVGTVSNLAATLQGSRDAPQLALTWSVTGAANSFVIDTSTDGVTWVRAKEVSTTNATISVTLATYHVRVAPVYATQGKWATWSGDVTSMVAIPAQVVGLQVGASADLTTFPAADAAFFWGRVADADSYTVEVWAAGAKVGSYSVSIPVFEYTYARNLADGLHRAFEVRVWAVNAGGKSAAPATLAVSNAQAPQAVVSARQSGKLTLQLTATDAGVTDYAGTLFAVANTQAGLETATPVDSPAPAATVAVAGLGTWYIKAAHYDVFGKAGVTWSAAISVAVADLEGAKKVADASVITAAAGSEPPGGDAYWAVYDLKTQRMASWDKAAGKYVFAPSEGDVEAKISAAVVPALDDITDLQTGLAAEATTRAQAISEEANARATALLQEQLAREAAITTTQQLQQSADQSLASEISQLSAGTGVQFDPVKIWYFNADLEGWVSSVGTAQVVDGWLRQPPGAYPHVFSPVGLGVDGHAYRFVKARIRKVGSPGWYGELGWAAGEWDFGSAVAIEEPIWGADGTATVSWDDIPWLGTGTIGRIYIICAVAEDASNYIEIDWIAIGRPTPGAGVAALEAERQARISGDAAEVVSRETLAAQLRGDYNGTDASQLTQGLLFSERTARVAADEAEADARTALAATVAGKADASAVQSLTTRVSTAEGNISSQAQAITDLRASTTGGGNLLPNAGFEVDAAHWRIGWQQVGSDPAPEMARDLVGAAWVPAGTHTLVLHRTGSPTGVQDFGAGSQSDDRIHIDEGSRYALSGYITTHRAAARLGLVFLDGNGNSVGETVTDAVPQGTLGGTNLAQWPRACVFAVAPMGARFAYIYCRQHAADTGASDPYTFLCRPQLEVATAAQTQPSPWAPGSAGLSAAIKSVESASIAADAALSQRIDTVSATASSAKTTADAAVTAAQQAQATADGKASAQSVDALSASLAAKSQSIYVGGSSDTFYPVLFQAPIEGQAYDLLASRGWVHEDASWTGTYACRIVAQACTWGNTPGTVSEITQQTGNGTHPWGVGRVEPQLHANGVLIWLRGGMHHHIVVTQPADAVDITVYLEGFADPENKTFAPIAETDAPTQPYLNQTWLPGANVSKDSVDGLNALMDSVSATITRVGTVETELGKKASAESVEQISARLNAGGDIQTAIVQVKATADATAGHVSGSWGLTIDAGGKVSGIKSYNDGATSSFQISADKIVLGDATNLCHNGQGESVDGWAGNVGVFDFNWANYGITAPNQALHVFSRDNRYEGGSFPVKSGEQYWCEFDSVPDGGGSNSVNYALGLVLYNAAGAIVDCVAGACRPAGSVGGYHASGVLTISNPNAVLARCWLQVDGFGDFPSTGYGFFATNIVVRKRATTEVLVPGCVTAEKISAEYTATTILQAKQAVIDYLAVKSLSAVCANIGNLTTAGWITATGDVVNSYGGVRSATDKWWNDGKTGFIFAYKQDGAESFFDLTAKNSYLKLSSWGDNVMHFADANGSEMLHVDSQTGALRVKGHVEAESGSFAGALSAASGTLGEITAGLLRNNTDTARLNLNETGSGEVLRIAGVTRVFGDGKTRWRNQIASLALRPRTDGTQAASTWDSQDKAYKIMQPYDSESTPPVCTFVVDTGIAMSSVVDAYDAQLSARISGWSIWWGRSASASDVLLADATPVYQLPVSSPQDWGNVTLHLLVTFRFRLGSPLLAAYADATESPIRLAELGVAIYRLS